MSLFLVYTLISGPKKYASVSNKLANSPLIIWHRVHQNIHLPFSSQKSLDCTNECSFPSRNGHTVWECMHGCAESLCWNKYACAHGHFFTHRTSWKPAENEEKKNFSLDASEWGIQSTLSEMKSTARTKETQTNQLKWAKTNPNFQVRDLPLGSYPHRQVGTLTVSGDIILTTAL